ncbi:type II secretion system F family protein [Phytoactinopolyspora endophytica]|uniref:type II secretion system F family protein n=1 Tax=Phytoactinopolyspora endophytica TaxID=1642495 RepID=UPI00101D369C|nr:type II secretion system F family protein [Phytoactinopolyspora endophytica]
MIAPMVLGAGLGFGLWAVAVWAFPPRPRLAVVLARLNTPAATPILATGDHGRTARMVAPLVRLQQGLGLPGESLRRDLAVAEIGVQAHLAVKAAGSVAGLAAPLIANLTLSTIGAGWGTQLPVLAGLTLAGVGFVLPDLQVRSRAAARRGEVRHALSVYLDLVVIALAGGAGVDAALHDASRVGDGWAFTQLRRALATARITRTSPWHSLRQLGDELGVTELAELAATASLAGTEGAKIRSSLATKAVVLRTHQLSAAEAEAQSATERMSLPLMLLFLAFLIFIGYPAIDQIVHSL